MCCYGTKPDILPCDSILDAIVSGNLYTLEDDLILVIRLKSENYSDDLHNKEFMLISKEKVYEPMEVIKYNTHQVVLKNIDGMKAKIVMNVDVFLIFNNKSYILEL